MEYRQLGKTDLQISVLGLGTMTWGLQNTQEEGFVQMDAALDRGINFFDTAEMYAIPPSAETYGTTERIIGNWFASRQCRDRVILASKIAGPGVEWIREGKSRVDRRNILKAVEDSLQRLQTDYIDLYQIHWPNRPNYHFGRTWTFSPKMDAEREKAEFVEVLETFQTLIDQGKIRHVGVSNESAWGLMTWLHLAEQHDLPRMASIQNEYSLLCRIFEPDLSEVAIAEECGLLAWSPLCRGMLSGKYLQGARPPGARLTIETRPEHRLHPKTDAAIEAYIQLARAQGLDPCQMALAFVRTRPFVTSVLIGATTMDQLHSNMDSQDLILTEEVLDGIAAIFRENPKPF